MDIHPELWWASSSVICLWVADVDMTSACFESDSTTSVHVVDGRRCQSERKLIREWKHALPFPDYCGSNWDAFEECLGDIGDWMPQPRCLIVIASCQSMLANKEAPFRVLMRILDQLAVGVEASSRERVRIVLQCPPSEAGNFMDRVKNTGVSVPDVSPAPSS